MGNELILVGRYSEIPERRSKLVHLEGVQIALWRVEGKIYAINNVCPHQHFSKLNEGTLEGLYVTCPMHGWSFCLEDGQSKSGGGRARVYQVQLKGEEIFLEKPAEGW